MVKLMSLDVFEYLAFLSQERYRSIILHAKPNLSASVTRFANKVCKTSDGKYLDLLDFFIKTKELRENIDGFSPENFRVLMMEQSNGVPLLFIDRIDFLMDTWRRRERKDFFRMISDQWDGYKEGMNAMVILCLQTSYEVENLHLTDSQGQSRIFQLSDFNDLL